jgi:hypothetical protein
MKIIINIGIISKRTISYVNNATAILNDIKAKENNKKLKTIIILTHFNCIIV